MVLTKRFHWPYVGGWLLLNIALTIILEFFVLYSLTRLKHVELPWPLEYYLFLTATFAVGFIATTSFIGLSWAHRIAGVYIRIERVFLAIAEGDHTQRLRFRASDQLEQLEQAFHAMMLSFEGPTKEQNVLESVDDDDDEADEEDPDAKERRSWKNMQLTSKYHFAYMTVWVIISLGQLILVYAAGFFAFQISAYTEPQGLASSSSALPLIAAAVGLTLGFVILWQGMKTAHKIAGVHIRLERTFRRIARGERDLELRFRASDKLEPLERAFATMMTSLRSG